MEISAEEFIRICKAAYLSLGASRYQGDTAAAVLPAHLTLTLTQTSESTAMAGTAGG